MVDQDPGSRPTAKVFRVIFSGEILPGKNPEEVKEKLKGFFKSNIFAVMAPFAGGRSYIRDGLDYEAAQKYLAAFTKAGAVCRVMELRPCPVCGALLEKDGECGRCAVEKDHQPKAARPAVHRLEPVFPDGTRAKMSGSTFGEVVDTREEYREKAYTFMSRGLVIFFLAMIAGFYYRHRVLFDTTWFYAAAWPYFILSLRNLSIYKGYPAWLGALLGLLQVLGLGLMLMLPFRSGSHSDEKSFDKSRKIGVALTSVILVFCMFPAVKGHKIYSYKDRLEIIMEKGRQIEPAPDVDQLMLSFITWLSDGVDIINEQKSSAFDSFNFSLFLLESIPLFFYDMEYRKYYLLKKDNEYPPEYSKENMEEVLFAIMMNFRNKASHVKDGVFLKTYFDWLNLQSDVVLCSPNNLFETITNVKDAIHTVKERTRLYMEYSKNKPPSNADQIINLSKYFDIKDNHRYIKPEYMDRCTQMADIDVSSDGLIILTFKKTGKLISRVHGKSLIFAPYYEKVLTHYYKRGKKMEKWKNEFRFPRVGGELDDFFRNTDSVINPSVRVCNLFGPYAAWKGKRIHLSNQLKIMMNL